MSRTVSSRPRLCGPPGKRMSDAAIAHIPFARDTPGRAFPISHLRSRHPWLSALRNDVAVRADWQVIKQWFGKAGGVYGSTLSPLGRAFQPLMECDPLSSTAAMLEGVNTSDWSHWLNCGNS